MAQKLLLLAALAIGVLLVGLPLASAGDNVLLVDVPGAVITQDTAVSRARPVEVNWNTLRNSQTSQIRINLFDGEVVTAVRDRIDQSNTGNGFVWVGHVAGMPDSSVTLSVVENVLIGDIGLERFEQYTIEYDGQRHVLQENNPDKAPQMTRDDVVIPPALPAGEAQVGEMCEDGSRVDLMFVYTTAARDHYGGPAAVQAFVNRSVANMNTANIQSGLPFAFRLVHVMETDYEETRDNSLDLGRLANKTDGYLDDVAVVRDQHKADLVALLVAEDEPGLCGTAYLMWGLTTNFESHAYSVDDIDCGTLVVAHEFGHSMGGHHDRANASSDPPLPYGYGYQSPNRTFRTIMAYNCEGGCPWINYWSNPDVNFKEEPTGIDYEVDPVNAADNVRSLEQTVPYVANFRPDCVEPPTPTPTPSATPTETPTPGLPPPVIKEIDNGDGDGNFVVEWLPLAGAEQYRLREGVNGEEDAVIFAGPDARFARSSLPKGQYCYRVRAVIVGGEWGPYSVVQCTTVNKETSTPTGTPTPQGLAAPILNNIPNADGDGDFVVSWSAVPGAEQYRLREGVDGADDVIVHAGPERSFSRSNLANGNYCYRVRAIIVDGAWGPYSETKCATVSKAIGTATYTPTPTPEPAFRIALPLVIGRRP